LKIAGAMQPSWQFPASMKHPCTGVLPISLFYLNLFWMTPPAERETMNRKPVLYREAKTVLTLPSLEFQKKLLCDGITLNLGDACAYSCEFCYVGAAMTKIDKPLLDLHNSRNHSTLGFSDVVIRRRNPIELLRGQLLKTDGSPIHSNRRDQRVVYSSTLVDVAANMALLRETAEACNLILEHTHWQIRLLSKSNLLHKLVEDKLIPERHHQRLIFGFSTGTLDDRVAKAIETGTPLVSKRLQSLHWLQDRGLRTYGMICPSLPQTDYRKFSREICEAIRIDRCEHVWAEVINLRGNSLIRCLASLRNHGLIAEAEQVAAVSGTGSGERWEEYARATFLAHTENVPANKLRFLQYVGGTSADWWSPLREKGAVLLGRTAEEKGLLTRLKATAPAVAVALQEADREFLRSREEIVTTGIKASIAAAKALHDIHSYKGGMLWRNGYPTFEAYCRARWDYGKSHAYRLVECGSFIQELETTQSPIGDWPRTESQIRPLLTLPKEERLACWQEILSGNSIGDITAKTVKAATLARVPPKAIRPQQVKAHKTLLNLRNSLKNHPNNDRIAKLLSQIGELLDQD